MTSTPSIADRQRDALDALSGFATAAEPLAPYTTYRVGGAAAVFATPRSLADLRRVAAVARDTQLPVLVVGRGSNMLVADSGFPGIAVSLVEFDAGIEGSIGGDGIAIDGVEVVAAAAVLLPVLARRTAAAGLTGFEWAVGVPGSVGGAVRMNAGGHGSDMAACLVGIHAFDLRSGQHGWVPTTDIGLRFRGSDLADHQVVLDARLRLAPGDAAASELTIAEIVRWRREHQPGGQNAGSVFVNPVPGELAAAELIDGLGLRGFTIGSAQVSTKHANFIQASPDGTAADVRAVMEHVRATVAAASGFVLRSEVRLVGFADVADESPAGVAVSG